MEQNVMNNNEIEIDLRDIFSVLRSNLVMIILTGIIFAVAAFLGTSLLISPTYESTTSLYILNRQSDGVTTYSDLQSSTQLTKDYEILVTSRTVMEQVISDLDLDINSTELANMITVTTPDDTRVLEITVAAKDPYQAKEIADQVADVAADSISEIMQTEKVDKFEDADYPEEPSSPNIVKNTAIAAVLGIVLAMAVCIIKYVVNDKIDTTEQIEKYLGISTLALIPRTEGLDDMGDTQTKKKKKKSKSSKKGEN